ncbi:hypothetical protein [Paenibacillus roseipurpureus]|uniref:Fibronectin type-III domain-containing protein n=1 Tax=Paenibacillus roseopurpureus TaxID=2918901 RepID=A0AA96LJJ4_9BACL|nr:hypothetical protein [Paenibacillus sp. MBLB1832]WNR42915.1 hypothetical protein MJB10_17550 [Paenibacillus sp. MBLB1832]
MNKHLGAFWLLLVLLLTTAVPVWAEQWEQVPLVTEESLDRGNSGGEGFQWMQGLAIDSDNGQFLVAVSDVGGIIRTENGGKQWEPSSIGFTPRGGNMIAIDPKNSNRVLIVGANGTAHPKNGLYLSTDKAKSWKPVFTHNISGNRDFRDSVAYDPSSYDAALGYTKVVYYSRIYEPKASGSPEQHPALYKSVDGGETWTEIPNSSAFGQSIIKVHPLNGYVYAANANGLFKSTDGGMTFTLKEAGPVLSTEVIASRPDEVYIVKSDGVYRSTDSGEAFVKVSEDFPLINPINLRISPVNPNQMVISDNAMSKVSGAYKQTHPYYSTDGGRTWLSSLKDNTESFGPPNVRQDKFVWSPVQADTVWGFGGDWIVKSTDGGVHFDWANNGYNGIMVGGAFQFNEKDPDLLYIGSQDYNGAFTQDGGATWRNINPTGTPYGGYVYGAVAVNPQLLISASAAGWGAPRTIRVSRDGGITFTAIDLGTDANGAKIMVNGAQTVFADPTDDHYLFVGEYRSSDQGYTWYKMDDVSGVYTSSFTGQKELYGGKGSNVLVSYDHGATWTKLTAVSGSVKDIAVDHVRKSLYVATEGKLYQYNLTAKTLTDITSRVPADQLGGKRIESVAIDPIDPSIVYAVGSADTYASDAAVARSTDAGQTWSVIMRNDRNSAIQTGLIGAREASWVRVNPKTRFAFVAGQCHGLWKIAPPGVNNSTKAVLKAAEGNGQVKLQWYGNGRMTLGNVAEMATNYMNNGNKEALLRYDMTGDEITGLRQIDTADLSLWTRHLFDDAHKAYKSFEVYRGLSAAGPYQKIAGPVTSTTLVDTEVTNGTIYYYKVVNLTDQTESAIVQAKPNAQGPEPLYVMEQPTSIRLLWKGGYGTYSVYRSDTVLWSDAVQLASGLTQTDYTDSTVVKDKPYVYFVTRTGTAGESEPTAGYPAKTYVPGTPPPPKPPLVITQGHLYNQNFDTNFAPKWLFTNASVSNKQFHTSWEASSKALYDGETYKGDYTYQVDAKVNGGGLYNRAQIVFNYLDSDNYYFLDIGSWDTATSSNTITLNARVEGGNGKIAGSATISNFNMSDKKTTIQVKYEDGGFITVTAIKDGIPTVLYNRVKDLRLPGGKVGIQTTYSDSEFDNVLITPLTNVPDPIPSMMGYQEDFSDEQAQGWSLGTMTVSGGAMGNPAYSVTQAVYDNGVMPTSFTMTTDVTLGGSADSNRAYVYFDDVDDQNYYMLEIRPTSLDLIKKVNNVVSNAGSKAIQHGNGQTIRYVIARNTDGSVSVAAVKNGVSETLFYNKIGYSPFGGKLSVGTLYSASRFDNFNIGAYAALPAPTAPVPILNSYSEDFSDGQAQGWSLGGMNVSSGALVNPSFTSVNAIYPDVKLPVAYSYQIDVNRLGDGDVNRARIYFDYVDSSNYYYLAIKPTAVSILKRINGTESTVGTVSYTNQSDAKIQYKIVRNFDGSVSVSADRTGEVTALFTGLNGIATLRGTIGAGTEYSASKFDNVAVSELIPSTAPASPALNGVLVQNLAELNWNAVTAAAGYNLYLGSSSGVYGAPLNLGNVTAYTVTGITYGTPTYVKVSAYNLAGEGTPSNEVVLSSSAVLYANSFDTTSLANWSLSGGTWTVSQATYALVQSDKEALAFAFTGLGSWTNVVASAKVTPTAFGTSGAPTFGILARVADANNRYSFLYVNGNLEISKSVGGTKTVLATKAFTAALGTTYTFQAVVNGNRLDFYVDGIKQLTASDSTFASGKFGLVTNRTAVRVDDVVIK